MRAREFCAIVPPWILRNIAERGDEEDRKPALATLARWSEPRRARAALALIAGPAELPATAKKRTIYDTANSTTLPGRRVRTEGGAESKDAAVNEAYDAAGATYDFYLAAYGRHSIDDRGLPLDSTVHYGENFDNAYWNGRQMVYGDGDGKYFRRFTSCVEIIGHELTHGVSQYTAGFGRTGQPGALSEHFSDVFGVLVKQWKRNETAAKADWLVGKGLFTSRVAGVAIRSMKAPGTAYDDPVIGRDPQVANISDYVETSADDGGVHLNCGIPNHAFYQVATILGGRAWEVAGRIWYRALTRELGPRSRFQQCADATWRAAGDLFGASSAPQEAVRAGWKAVGIDVSKAVLERGPRIPVRKRRARQEPEPVDLPTAGADAPVVA